MIQLSRLTLCLVFVLATNLCLSQNLPPNGQYPNSPHPTIQLPDFKSLPIANVLRVVDGDTVVLLWDNQKVTCRLIGIDTPETKHPKKPVEQYGIEASRFTENLLRGEKVWIAVELGASQIDKYGRALVYLFRVPDGLFINLEIVRQGYGHVYRKYPFSHSDVFRRYEKKAREARKGLWNKRTPSHGNATTLTPTSTPTIEPQRSSINKRPSRSATVYVTRTGKKYHTGRCRYLRKSKIKTSVRNAVAEGYGACSVCRPPRLN